MGRHILEKSLEMAHHPLPLIHAQGDATIQRVIILSVNNSLSHASIVTNLATLQLAIMLPLVMETCMNLKMSSAVLLK